MKGCDIRIVRALRAGLLLAAMWSIAWPLSATGWTLVLNPDETRIKFTLEATLHTVDGSFDLASGEVRFDDGTRAVSGEVVVDARSGKTGIGRRDRTMREDVLESDEFPTITFRPERIQGTFDPAGASEFLLLGTVTIHGAVHPLTTPVVAVVDGERFTARAVFTIPFVEWGLEDPSSWYLRVAKEVVVLVELVGRLTASK